MPVHLLKMAVGADGYADLARRQAARLRAREAAGQTPHLIHLTRSTPRRAAEVLDGGSIYWVMGGAIRARQRVAALEPAVGRDGGPGCAIVLDPGLVATQPSPCRPFQGWRYLAPSDAPADVPAGTGDLDGLPPAMVAELRRLGLV